MPDLTWHEHADAQALATALADTLETAIREAVAQRGRACLALAGGSTPLGAYQRLGGSELPWSAVTLVPTDERCVAIDDERSNAGMLRRLVPAEATVVDLSDAAAAEHRVQGLSLPFDLVLLGMGSDGHTASLFPDDPDIRRHLESTTATVSATPPSQPTRRVSLTPGVLVRTRAALLALSGAEKRSVLEQALNHGDGRRYPVGALATRFNLPLNIHWYP